MVPRAGAALQAKVLTAYIGEAGYCVCEHRGSGETEPLLGYLSLIAGRCLQRLDLIPESCSSSYTQSCDGCLLFKPLKCEKKVSKMSMMKCSLIQLER